MKQTIDEKNKCKYVDIYLLDDSQQQRESSSFFFEFIYLFNPRHNNKHWSIRILTLILLESLVATFAYIVSELIEQGE